MSRWHFSELDVKALPEPCRSCVFWEAGGRPAPVLGERERARGRVAKESWWQATALEWGACGLGAWHGERLLGYAFVAPSAHLRGAPRFGRVSDDALLLANLWIDGDEDPEPISRALVEGSMRVAAARGAQAVEAFASPSGQDSCLPSEAIVRSCGFALLRAGHSYPHYRLDLGQTARWRESVEEALAGMRRLLRGRKLGEVPSMPSSAAASLARGPQDE